MTSVLMNQISESLCGRIVLNSTKNIFFVCFSE